MKNQAVEQALKIIDSRINAFGVKEPTLQRHGAESSGQILLQMPGVDDPERVKKLIGSDSNLALMKVVGPPNPVVQTYPTKEAAMHRWAEQFRRTAKVYPVYRTRRYATTRPPTSRPKQ